MSEGITVHVSLLLCFILIPSLILIPYNSDDDQHSSENMYDQTNGKYIIVHNEIAVYNLDKIHSTMMECTYTFELSGFAIQSS